MYIVRLTSVNHAQIKKS